MVETMRFARWGGGLRYTLLVLLYSRLDYITVDTMLQNEDHCMGTSCCNSRSSNIWYLAKMTDNPRKGKEWCCGLMDC